MRVVGALPGVIDVSAGVTPSGIRKRLGSGGPRPFADLNGDGVSDVLTTNLGVFEFSDGSTIRDVPDRYFGPLADITLLGSEISDVNAPYRILTLMSEQGDYNGRWS